MNKVLLNLTQSQLVCLSQCKYTLYKRVINILASVSLVEGGIDWNLMEKAFNIAVERNDCMRLRFVKQGKEIKQYFLEHDQFENIPRLSFKTQEEFDSFVLKNRKKPIKYLKGKVVEPYFIDFADGRQMVYLKVCHLILDIYGINFFFNDLMAVYNALKDVKEMPEQPGSFEALIQKDLKYYANPSIYEKNRSFLQDCLDKREMPVYAGIHGDNSAIWMKEKAKNAKSKKMAFIHCDTATDSFEIDKDIVEKAIERATATGESLSVFLNYCYAITAGIINGFPKNILSLELCNCRGTVTEKKTGGTKVQSSASFADIDWSKSFNDNFAVFCSQHNEMFKHIGFSDVEFETMLHKQYNFPMLCTLWNYCYSLVPVSKPEDIEITGYSNGKGALICYIAQFWNTDTNQVSVSYDYQYRLISYEVLKDFHQKYEKVMCMVLDEPDKDLNKLFEDFSK